jgi:hypothetical protein
MRICMSRFGLATSRKSLDARHNGSEERGGAVRGGARRDFLPGYNLVILVHKTSGNRGIYPRHLEKEIGGKRSWQARMRRNKSRRFAKAYAKLQLFAVVMEECVEFNVGLFGLATLRKGLGARRG